jgi:hypothetical protein
MLYKEVCFMFYKSINQILFSLMGHITNSLKNMGNGANTPNSSLI